MKRGTRKYILNAVVALVGLLIFWGTRNEVDPYWNQLDSLLEKDYFTLAEAKDSIVDLYHLVHKSQPSEDEIFDRIATPFMPIMEFQKFQRIIKDVIANQFVVFTSVNGSGTSTLTNRLARFVATGEDNILRVVGVPNYDLFYHNKYIVDESDDGFKQGLLLDFMDRCLDHPDENFVFVFDDIEKMEPESFFGPEIWFKLYDRDSNVKIGDKDIIIPPNFYMISVAHVSPTAHVTLTEQHFRRLGKPIHLQPDVQELILYLQSKLLKDSHEKSLNEIPNIKSFVYAFNKSNELIASEFDKSYTMGQWSPIRHLYKENDFKELEKAFLFHVNSFRPRKEIKKSDFDGVKYSLRNQGKLKGSNFIRKQLINLEEKGFLTEFLVGVSFLLISGIVSFFFFRQRERIISEQIKKMSLLYNDFENQNKDYDHISKEIMSIKDTVDKMALEKKINYEEATFFYQYFYDKSRKVEIAKEAYQHFHDLVEVSMEDGVLSDKEYQKLNQFLQRIKPRIGHGDYEYFLKEIKSLREKHGVKK